MTTNTPNTKKSRLNRTDMYPDVTTNAPNTKTSRLHRTDYHVAWISPVATIELYPAILMFDEKHDPPSYDTELEPNIYRFGSIEGHNVVVATCPSGMTGNTSVSRVVATLFNTFPNLKMSLLVGIGGGVPRPDRPRDPERDIHVGDVIIGWPGDGQPPCINYDVGRWHSDTNFEIQSIMNRPNTTLIMAMDSMYLDYHEMNVDIFSNHRLRLQNSNHPERFVFPGLEKDRLYEADYCHVGDYYNDCDPCDSSRLVNRPQRDPLKAAKIHLHKGRIATGNAVIQNALRRDRISRDCGGVYCIEMEAAGVNLSSPCLVIRGISDYADTHKHDSWRSYAAGNAAVVARGLLGQIPSQQPVRPPRSRDVVRIKFDEGMTMSFSTFNTSIMIAPEHLDDVFVGRREQLNMVTQSFMRDSSQANVFVLQGLGGMGKTQIALKYISEHSATYQHVLWVHSATEHQIHESFERILKSLGATRDYAQVIQESYVELSATNRKVLLVFDNLDDEKLLFRMKTDHAARWPKSFDVLITTRNRAFLELSPRHFSNVESMSDGESLQLLQELLRSLISHQESHEQSLRRINDALGHIPLAIHQAACYMIVRDIQPEGYLARLSESAHPVLQTGSGSRHYTQTIHTVFQDTLRCIEGDPYARDWFYLSSFFDGNLPHRLFTFSHDFYQSSRDRGQQQLYPFLYGIEWIFQIGPWSLDSMQQHVQLLSQLLLVKTTGTGGEDPRALDATTTLHPLLQDFARSSLSADEQKRYISMAISLIYACAEQLSLEQGVLSHTRTAYHTQGWLIRHVDACAKFASDHLGRNLASMIPLECLMMISTWYTYRQRYEEAEEFLTVAISRLTGEDTLLIEAQRSLALVLRRQKKLKEAEEIQICAIAKIADSWKVGAQDEATHWRAQAELASIYRDQGQTSGDKMRLGEAIMIQAGVVDASSKQFGDDALSTLHENSCLASMYDKQHEYDKARLIQEHIVKIMDDKYPNHIGRFDYMKNLAITYFNLKRLTDAASLEEQVLKGKRQLYGESHLETAAASQNLATTYESQEKYSNAQELYRNALSVREKLLGPDHPSTIKTRGCLDKLKEAMHPRLTRD